MSGYSFSQVYQASHVSYSPGTTFLATLYQNRLIIRQTSSLQIIRSFTFRPSSPLPSINTSTNKQGSSSSTSHLANKAAEVTLDGLHWSSDSMYILVFSKAVGTVWAFSLTEVGHGEDGEVAKVEGAERVEWGRGKAGRDVLVWSELGLDLKIYNLTTGKTRMIQYPKSSTHRHTYSANSRYLAIVERHSGKDHVGIYDVWNDYALIRHFPLSTNDVQSLTWSPCSKYLSAVDHILTYALHLYTPLGLLLHIITPNSNSNTSPSPSSSTTYTTEDPGLGIRTTAFAPSGKWIAIGGWDGKLGIWECESGRRICDVGFGGRVGKTTVVWKEPKDWLKDTRGHGIVQCDKIPTPTSIPTLIPTYTPYPPRSGISQLSFNPSSTHLLVRLETQPNIIHILSFLPDITTSTPVINHVAVGWFDAPIKAARWEGVGESGAVDGERGRGRERVVVTTGIGGLFFWDGEGDWEEDGEERKGKGGMMEGVGIPSQTGFKAHDTVWSPGSKCLAILDRVKHQFCVLYDEAGDGDASGVEVGIRDGGGVERDRSRSGSSWEERLSEGLSFVEEGEEEEEEEETGFMRGFRGDLGGGGLAVLA